MNVHLTSPAGLAQGTPYHHVSIATGTRQLHVAGQVGGHADGTPLAATLRGQVSQSLRNCDTALRANGASWADVVRMTFYVTQWEPEHMGDLLADVAGETGPELPMPPATLIGVEALYAPDVLVEIEVTAVLP